MRPENSAIEVLQQCIKGYNKAADWSGRPDLLAEPVAADSSSRRNSVWTTQGLTCKARKTASLFALYTAEQS